VSRYILLICAVIIAGCSQRAMPFASTSSQPTLQNAGTTAAKPTESVIARVAFKNDTRGYGKYATEFTVYWSYRANPIWHVQLRECVKPGDEVKTDVVYNHINSGPQIKFEAELASYEIFKCSLFRARNRTIAFHSMNFEPNADFHVVYKAAPKVEDYTLCARGGGHAETCKNGR
jgi:hypothetical protein